MKILLDTHIIIWAATESPKLPRSARNIILQPDNDIFFSTVSLWEIEIKRIARPNQLPFTTRDFSSYCKRAEYKLLNLNEKSIYMLSQLTRPDTEPPHKDPFDRMLICQAMSEGMKLLTHDSLIKGYASENILYV